MKTIILVCAITVLMVATNFTAFGQENKKAKEARKDLAEAKVDSAADFQKFKKEAKTKITENEKEIVGLKAKWLSDNNYAKEKHDLKVDALQQKNDNLKKRIEESDGTKTTKWSSFKHEFNHDMDELGRAIKDFTVENEKK
jgi:hypothetical protein